MAVDGLPPGAQSSVTVTGPNSYRSVLGWSSTLTGLRDGTYTIVASDVTSGNVRYAATPVTQTVVVSGGTLATASSITYVVASARLAVTVVGLPSGTQAAVTVTGPNAYTRTLGGTTSLELLAPGTYSIVAATVQGTGKTYRAAPGTQSVTLVASVTPGKALVAYGAGTGLLDLTVAGLPAGTDASITVTGPDGISRPATSSTTLQYLEAGTYTITAAVVGSSLTTHTPSPASQTVNVIDAGTGSATVTYASSDLQLGLQFVVGGLTNPVYLTAPDGDARLFVVERSGLILIVKNGSLLTTPFLDIQGRVKSDGERGMLSIVFDPQYATNGSFYAYYMNRDSAMAVEKFSSNPGSDVAGASAGMVITIPHGGLNHHGGQIAFGLDGMFYVAPGDGGCCNDPQNNAQNTASLLGKILRIDVMTLPYTIPPGNPFIGSTFDRPEIWAYGLRNPWRYSFDAESGMLYIGDVGQDTREEVDVVPATAAGRNYGWRLMEGMACFNPTTACNNGSLTLPVLDYLHTEGCSVIGGYVYRGSAIPELWGHYLYSDYCRGWLRSFRYTGGGTTDLRSWAGISAPYTVSFGRDGAGELYMVGSGRVSRIVRQ